MTHLLTASGLALPGRLHPTDFTLKAGELACLIGPNGSGKSSLLHTLARIGKPAGTVHVEGEDIGRLGPEQRARLLAYLPASRDIAWPLLARDIVALGGAGQEAADRECFFQSLGIADLADRRMDHLSTGERARVLLARALAGAPKVLLLDEPTANLDPLWQLRMMDRLRAEAHEAGRALLVAVHDLDTAHKHADRLIIMQDGRIAADGNPAEILEGPAIPAIFGVRRVAGGWQAA